MKKIVLFAFLFISGLSFSQNWDFEKPNYEKIEKNIQEKNSPLFYKSLMNRFVQADSTMTLEEKRHLYYGYTFNDHYAPYSRSDYGDSLRAVVRKSQLDSVDLKNIVRLSDLILAENPFDLNAMNYQLYALEQTGNKKSFEKRVTQLRIIVRALLSSGNGKTKKDAFYVIYTAHEYELLNILGLQFGGSQSLIEHYDYLTVAENDADIDGLYFDVSPCLNFMNNMLKE